MNRIAILLLLILLYSNLPGQTIITFRLDMQPLINKNLFSFENGESVFIRGRFNQWNGNDYKLKRNGDDNILSGTFNFNTNIDDTIEYKFVIKKPEGQIYWEKNPNPANSNYGNRKLIITGPKILPPIATFDYDEYIQYPVAFSKEKLQKDFVQMRKALEENHPALYDYTVKGTIDSLFEQQYKLIDKDLGFNEYYIILSSVLSRIGCGHTKLWIPSDYWNIVPKGLFPLKIQLCNENVFVSGFYSDSITIPLGSEIVFVNNEPIQDVIKKLKSIHSADGFNQAFKSKSVEKNFSKKYALYFGYPRNFRIKYIAPGEFTIKDATIIPVSFETINKEPVRGSTLSLKILKNSNTAIITINTFIYYDQLEMFKSFIDSTFEVIQNKKISNLIIDLRGNDGGDPFCSSYVLSYIEYHPVPYFAKPYGKYASLAEPIPLAKNRFRDNLYTLVDGCVFSTTGHFCALLKNHKIGKLVGSETGATFTCTGSVRYINLEHTKLILGTARNQRYSVAVQCMDRTRGIIPDYQVEQTQNDLINGKDTVLEFVLNLINNNQKD